jgi:hypothetical protein
VAFCFLWTIATTCLAQQKSVTFLRLGRDILKHKVDKRPASKHDRIPALHKLFAEAGCEAHEQQLPGAPPNLFCSSHGTSDSVIVILAASDYSSKGDEAVVQWSDLVMLPILAESIGSVLTRHTFVFLAASGSAKKFGVSAYLNELTSEQRQKIHAVIAFDHLGRAWITYSVPGSPFGFDLRNGSPKWNPDMLPLTRSIPAASARWDFPIPRKDDAYGSKNTRPFVHEDIPAITFSSPRSTVIYVGDRPVTRDFHTVLNMDEYNRTYLFLSIYLLMLDQDLGQSPPGSSDGAAPLPDGNPKEVTSRQLAAAVIRTFSFGDPQASGKWAIARYSLLPRLAIRCLLQFKRSLSIHRGK